MTAEAPALSEVAACWSLGLELAMFLNINSRNDNLVKLELSQLINSTLAASLGSALG